MGGPGSRAGGRLPALFVGHGSPLNCVADNAFTCDMRRLGGALPRPAAVVCVSAHWQTSGPFVTAGARPETIYDFYGFPPELYEVTYPASGSPEVAALVVEATGGVVRPADRGIDHAAWMVLRNVFPEADVPVLEMSLDLTLDERGHYELGRRLATLREQDVLVMGSGNVVHNLYEIDWAQDAAPADWAIVFDAWVRDAVAARRHDELIGYLAHPLARRAAPTAEHYLPLLYTLALQDDGERIETVHESFQHATVSMRSFMTV